MTYELYGAHASPYSMKMRAVLRYRRIPHAWRPQGGGQGVLQHVRAPVIPVMRFPDGSWRNDSTVLIQDLEAAEPNERSLVPPSPVHAFLALLLEDFADEWGTKVMFHHRWAHPDDREANARKVVADVVADPAALDPIAAAFAERQVGRMPLVGCTPQSVPVIEATGERVAGAFDALWPGFLFGTRPSAADFAWYGQLSQLLDDPTPGVRLFGPAPRAALWVRSLDDASGLEDGRWLDDLPEPARWLIALCVEVHLPFPAANAAAAAEGRSSYRFQTRLGAVEQPVSRYLVRCRDALMQSCKRLDDRQIDELRHLLGSDALEALDVDAARGEH